MELLGVSENLLTHFTGENTHGQEFRVGVPYGLGVGLGRLPEVEVVYTYSKSGLMAGREKLEKR